MVSKAKLQSSVDKAFAKLDALTVTATFTNKTVSSFDFTAGEVVSTSTTYVTKGFIENKKSYIDSVVGSILTLIVKTGGINFNAYTTVNVDNVNYNCSVLDGNEYVTTLKIVRID